MPNDQTRPSDSSGSSPIAPTAAAPVQLIERIGSIDVLRGVALLGILVINIEFFALPSAMYFNPSLAGGFEGLDLLTWKAGYLFFLQKMMAVFSMLFGAGLVLLYDRIEAVGGKLKGLYYRRIFWLLVIGMLHAYFLWYGDILVSYAIVGLILFLFRRRSPRALIITGVCVLMFGMAVQWGAGFAQSMLREQAYIAMEAQEAGEPLQAWQEDVLVQWAEMSAMFKPTPEELAHEIEQHRGSFAEVHSVRVAETVMMQTQGLLMFVLWRASGLMLLGMGLMKLGVFSGKRSKRFYAILVGVGYGLGVPLVWFGMEGLIDHGFDIIYRFQVGNQLNYVGGILVALGHVGVVMLLCQREALKWLTGRLAAVGRMALTNYLVQSILCTTLFYGYGAGLFGQLSRTALLGIVVAIWILQLVYSPIWLKRYRFGPAEWVWRSLTYWRRQPMKHRSTAIRT